MTTKNFNLRQFKILLNRLQEYEELAERTQTTTSNSTVDCIFNKNTNETLQVTTDSTSECIENPLVNREEIQRRIRHIISVLTEYKKLKKIKDKIALLSTCYEGNNKWKMPGSKSITNSTLNSRHSFLASRKESAVQKKKNHICLFCYKSFTSKSGIDLHYKSHNGEKPSFYCAHCSASFYRKDQCQRHVASHTNYRSQYCHKCCRSFKCSNELLQHEKEHTEGKRYQCRFCSKKFRTKQICERHEMIYHEGLSHICRTCSRKFASNLALVIHRQKCSGKPKLKSDVESLDSIKQFQFRGNKNSRKEITITEEVGEGNIHSNLEPYSQKNDRSKKKSKQNEKNLILNKKSHIGTRRSRSLPFQIPLTSPKNKNYNDTNHVCRFC